MSISKMTKITAYTKDQQPHEVTDTINSGNAVDPESYYLIGIYIGTFGGPTFAVQADNEHEAIEEFAASKYGHFILIDNEKDLAEYADLDVVHWTDAGPCYIDEPIAYIAEVDHWDEFTARQIALKNLPDEIMIEIEEDRLGNYSITVDDLQERKWIAATNLYNHTPDLYLQTSQEIENFASVSEKSCSEISDEGYVSLIAGYYTIDTDIYLNLIGGQLG